MPKFSVIIPLYNKEQDFPLTLKSVLNQTFRDFELIIVNDGSTDNSLAIAEAEAEKDKRFKVFNRKNEGVSASRNYGVEKATSENIVFMDADDYWYPFHLENMDSILKKFPEAEWFATAYEKKYNEKLIHKMVSPITQMDDNWIGEVDFFENSLADSIATGSSLGMKKSFFKKLGGYNIHYNFSEDTDFWIRAALQATVAFSNKISAVILLNTTNRANHYSLKSRIFPDFDSYNCETEKNLALKKYLDVHRFSIALNYKLAGDSENFKKYRTKIAPSSLNATQCLLMKAPRQALVASKSFKNFLHKSGMYFSVYK